MVNQMTPDGHLPDQASDNAALEQSLTALAGKLFG